MVVSRRFAWLVRHLVVVGVVALAVSAGTGPASAQGTFRVAVGVDLDTMDPAQMTTTTVANMVEYVVENLTSMDEAGQTRPMLAESWTASPDGLHYTFKLRPGVTFHDGTAFNAQAVKWNLDRVRDPNVRVPIRAPYPMDKVEAVDAQTVRVTLTQPFAPFVSALSWNTAGIVSPASADKHGNEYKNIVHPIGTGPYVLKERRKGESLTVTRYDKYWGRKPHYESVVFRVVPEAATRESLLLAGQVDLIILPPIADLPALSRNPAVKVILGPSDRTMFIAFNTTRAPYTDRRVRQALNYAVDKAAIIRSVLFGAADIMDAPMAPSLFGYCKVGSYDYNPAKAKELLAAAGVKAGAKVAFVHPTGRYTQDREVAQAIAGYLREVGLDPQLQTMDWPSYLRTVNVPADKATTDIHMLGWAPAYLDAAQQMLQFLSTYAPPAGLATSYYKDASVDAQIQAAGREPSPDKRKDLYCQASKKVWEDAPWIFLYVQRFPIVHSAKVRDIGSLPNEKFYGLYARPTQ